MKVADILKSKGTGVKTVRPDLPVLALAERLRDERIGAMIVSRDGRTVDGIISERDIAYGLATHGPSVSKMSTAELMTKAVTTCTPADSVTEIANSMTQGRFRHMPVLEGGFLVGIVTIGDVLKHRVAEVQMEANVLRDYAIARR